MVEINSGTRTGQRIDPFASYKFHIEIGDIIEAFFTECSGLDIATEVFEYKEGGLNEFSHKLPGRTIMSNVTLKRGFALSNELFNWFQEMNESLNLGKGLTMKLVTITLHSSAVRGTAMRWTLHDAFPVKWVGPTLNTSQANVAIETIEFAHHGITLT
jgi:phage tail-like protein